MTVTVARTTTPPHERVPSPPARLSLTPASVRPGLLDGAWWPRSADLSRELPALIQQLDAHWGRITRVTVHPAHWPVIPHQVSVNGHTVHVGWSAAEQDPHTLTLSSPTVGRWDLLVVPSGTDAAAAARLMAAAAAPGNVRTAGRMPADEATARDARELHSREEEWEGEGGSLAAGDPAEGPGPPRTEGCEGVQVTRKPEAAEEKEPVEAMPSAGRAEVRIVAACPETARQVAETLRRSFATTEQRSYPAGSDGGTRLHLTVDTAHPARPARSWLASGRSSGDNEPQADEV